jgi:hypothetical protein
MLLEDIPYSCGHQASSTQLLMWKLLLSRWKLQTQQSKLQKQVQHLMGVIWKHREEGRCSCNWAQRSPIIEVMWLRTYIWDLNEISLIVSIGIVVLSTLGLIQRLYKYVCLAWANIGEMECSTGDMCWATSIYLWFGADQDMGALWCWVPGVWQSSPCE